MRTELIALIILVSNMKQRTTRKLQQLKLSKYTPSLYTKSLYNYLRSTAKHLDPLLRNLAYRSPLAPLLPLFQLLRATAKLFLLSQFELLLLASKLQELEWDIDSPVIVHNAQCMGQLVCIGTQRKECRKAGLLLMLVSYWAKLALSEDTQYLLDQANKVCFGFKHIFQQWLTSTTLEEKIQPNQLNHLYFNLARQLLPPNYNYMVDQIVTLSHAYKSEKHISQFPKRPLIEIENSPSEREAGIPTKLLKSEYQALVHPHIDFISPNLNKKDEDEEEQVKLSSLRVFQRGREEKSHRFSRFFEASQGLSMPFPSLRLNHSMKPDWDCDYIQVGLCQGESAELVIKQAFTSSILVRKQISEEEGKKPSGSSL